ncbi:sigma-70 family RNA polymerase sigma factor [Actinoplanes solisilvae]|uniref:sigma-70 family RNA polymerase sigma factor n=1 Tax=Actinoplanes solisilvae TaxID=2486853 RepID=UPI000FDA5936|nr:sigma-70 family RNA polymerase sigma factor [Actinoplanes solisilvae]
MPPHITCREANRRAKELIDTHWMPLTRFVLPFTRGQQQAAEDVVQETVIRAWKNLDQLPDSPDGTRRWLMTVARRILIDQARRTKTRPIGRPLPADEYAGNDDVSNTVVAADSFRHGLETLSVSQRRVLDEIFVNNRTPQEVADLLEIPLGTVRSRQHYALQTMRRAVLG